jgi:cytochrome c
VLLRRAAGAAALAAAGAALPLAAAADADLAAGERVFRSQCMGCHAIEEGRNRAGPTLHGLFGREAGTLEGFDYSDAMREAGIVWSEETLDASWRIRVAWCRARSWCSGACTRTTGDG